MRVPVYQIDNRQNRCFIKLGMDHNYGRCFELICWLNASHVSNLALYYASELADAIPTGTVSIVEAIQSLKSALKFTRFETFYVSYMNYVHLSAVRCLGHMLESYSFYKQREHAAKKIQQRWRPLYENPASHICQRRLKREFEELHKLTWG